MWWLDFPMKNKIKVVWDVLHLAIFWELYNMRNEWIFWCYCINPLRFYSSQAHRQTIGYCKFMKMHSEKLMQFDLEWLIFVLVEPTYFMELIDLFKNSRSHKNFYIEDIFSIFLGTVESEKWMFVWWWSSRLDQGSRKNYFKCAYMI